MGDSPYSKKRILSIISCLLFRLIETAKVYPHFNEGSETNWKKSNANTEMSQEMAKITSKNHLKVQKIGCYKVHDMRFKKQEGTSLQLADCSHHSTAKEK